MSIVDHYSQGNDHFREGKFELAFNSYSLAISLISSPFDSYFEKLYLNRCLCSQHLRNYELVVKDCSMVLTHYPDSIKALLRRAQSFKYLGLYEKALDDTNRIFELNPPKSLFESTVSLKSELQFLIQEELEISSNQPTNLVTKHHTLRLQFRASNITECYFDDILSFKLCIGNEFGLWDRTNLQSQTFNPSESYSSIAQSLTTQLRFLDLISSTHSSSFTTFSLVEDFRLKEREYFFREYLKSHLSLNIHDCSFSLQGRFDLQASFSLTKQNLSISSSPLPLSSTSDLPEPTPLSLMLLISFHLDSPLPSGKNVLSISTLPITLRIPSQILQSLPTPFIPISPLLLPPPPSTFMLPPTTPTSSFKDLDMVWMRENATCVRDTSILLGASPSPSPNPSPTAATCDSSSSSPSALSVSVLECPGSLGIGGKVWDSSYILLDFLQTHRDSLLLQPLTQSHPHLPSQSQSQDTDHASTSIRTNRIGRNVLELGSGTGVTGLGISLLSSTSPLIVLTDLPPVVPLLSANISLHRALHPRVPTSTIPIEEMERRGVDSVEAVGVVRALPFTWGTEFQRHECERECEEALRTTNIGSISSSSPRDRGEENTTQSQQRENIFEESEGDLEVMSSSIVLSLGNEDPSQFDAQSTLTSSTSHSPLDLTSTGNPSTGSLPTPIPIPSLSSEDSSLLLSCSLIVASDVVYDPIGYSPLLHSLRSLLLLESELKNVSTDLSSSSPQSVPAASNSNSPLSGSQEHCSSLDYPFSFHSSSSSPVPSPSSPQSKKINEVRFLDVLRRFGDQSVPQSERISKLCVLAHRHRHPEDQKFFDQLFSDKNLVVVECPHRWQQNLNTDEISPDISTLQDIRIFFIFR